MMKWGIGVEHEMHFFSFPPHGELRALPDIVGLFYPTNANILIDLKDPSKSTELMKKYGLSKDEISLFLLSNIDPKLENSAKRCAGLIPAQANMLELINVDHMNRTAMSIHQEFEKNTKLIMSCIKKILKDPKIRETINLKNIGDIATYPYGAAIFKDLRRDVDMKDYTGSWQFTFTLPHPPNISNSVFIVQHEKFGNQLQWLEPLLAATLFTPDPSCVVSEGYAFSAYRTVRYGWGNFGGTDVRRFHKGIGRRANVFPTWRNKLNIKNTSNLSSKRCMQSQETAPSKNMDELCGKFGNISSDMRTFGIENGNRVSGAPMSIGYGFEFRIFDNFDTALLKDVMSMLIHVAENSKMTSYHNINVYKDPDWVHAMQSVIKFGWRATVTPKYLKRLAEVLEIPAIADLEGNAEKLCDDVFSLIRARTKDGQWVKLMLGARLQKSGFKVPHINKNAWSHFYKCAFNSRNRIEINKAINKAPLKFHLSDIKLSNPYLTTLLPYVVETEKNIVVEGSHYKRTAPLKTPLVNMTVDCHDARSNCTVKV